MRIQRSTRDCCTPWSWLARLLLAFLLGAAVVPRAMERAGPGLPGAEPPVGLLPAR